MRIIRCHQINIPSQTMSRTAGEDNIPGVASKAPQAISAAADKSAPSPCRVRRVRGCFPAWTWLLKLTAVRQIFILERRRPPTVDIHLLAASPAAPALTRQACAESTSPPRPVTTLQWRRFGGRTACGRVEVFVRLNNRPGGAVCCI